MRPRYDHTAVRRSWKAALFSIALSAPLLAQDITLAQRMVVGLRFRGNRHIPAPILSASIATSNSSWNYRFLGGILRFLPGTKRYLDETELRRDVLRIQLLYRQHGYYQTRVDTTVQRTDDKARITFHITEGPPTLVDTVIVAGVDSVENSRNIARGLPLSAGRPFNRFLFNASADTITSRLRDRGYPFAEVFRSYSVDLGEERARAEFSVETGKRARIGEIVVEGLDRVSRRTVLRTVRARPGSVFRQQALFNSQRALYQRDLFRYVSVGLHSDSLMPGSDTLVRLLVRVVEAEKLTMRNGIGYGTIDCIRTQSNVRVRNFLGEARLLDLTGRLSKIGVGDPLDFNANNSICPELAHDRFSSDSAGLNYNISATITQPGAIIRRSTLSVSGFAERRSEFDAYLHETYGGGVGLRITFAGWVPPLSFSYRLSNDRTQAEPAVYCIFFDQCDPNVTNIFRNTIRQGRFALAVNDNSLDNPLEPVRGRQVNLELVTASALTGSEVRFDRLTGEIIQYFPLGGRRTVATRFRAGLVNAGRGRIGGDTVRYAPPPDRFYAGGPTTVRGFGRNEMGPVVYVVDRSDINVDTVGGVIDTGYGNVRASPLGSAGILLMNAELRVPTPVFGGKLSLAAYVDAGQLWEQTGAVIEAGPMYITPGIGLQFTTPLGPMRLDAAYNRYDRQAGRLYVIEGDTLTLADPAFRRGGGGSFLRRMQYHFSVGVPF